MAVVKISEQEIIQTIQAGDFQHFDELVNRYTNYVYRVSLKMIHQAEDAEDCLQETFLKLFRSIKNYQADSKFSTWLYRITVNTCLDRIRRASRQSLDSEIMVETLPAAPGSGRLNPEKALLTKELNALIRKTLQELPAPARQAVTLVDMEKLSYEEAARQMDLTLPAFKSRLRRARLTIQERLSEYIQKY